MRECGISELEKVVKAAVIYCRKYDFSGVNSQKVITFLELIPKKSYICIVNIQYYD